MIRRNTAAKQKIAEILKSSKVALSQDAIEKKAKGSMNRVTVYRVLNSFCEDGQAHRIVSDEGKYYFALCHNCRARKHHDNHFHFQCLKCHKIECLKKEVKAKIPKGYILEDMNCLLRGYCRECG